MKKSEELQWALPEKNSNPLTRIAKEMQFIKFLRPWNSQPEGVKFPDDIFHHLQN